MLNKIILTITFITLLASITSAQNDELINQPQIDITATTSKIKWDGDVLRTWNATDNVVIEYTRSNKRFYCTADNVSFYRSGNSKPFIDKLKISGNINADLNGMKIKSENLLLISDADNYQIDSDTQTTIETDSVIVITGLLHFDASSGIGNFPDGAEFVFFLEDNKTDSQRNPKTDKTENMFGECLRIDTTGGRLITPTMQILYTFDDTGDFKASSVTMPSGGELYPLETNDLDESGLYESGLYESKFVFGCVDFNIEESRFIASKQVKLVNGQCEISASKVEINWKKRHLKMSGDVILIRDIVEFKSGVLEIIWDDEGRISLTATQKPSMCIQIPDNETNEFADK